MPVKICKQNSKNILLGCFSKWLDTLCNFEASAPTKIELQATSQAVAESFSNSFLLGRFFFLLAQLLFYWHTGGAPLALSVRADLQKKGKMEHQLVS